MTENSTPPRLFIPGPVEIEREVLEEMQRPMIGHRAPEFSALGEDLNRLAKGLFRSDDPVYILTSSATGAMECSVRNCVREKVLCFVNGAFSERFFKICQVNGKEATRIDVDWGMAVKPGLVKEALAGGDYDAVTIVHNETSTGVLSPLEQIAEVVSEERREILLLVDGVTSVGSIPIEFGKYPIDVLLTGSQKSLALPPGLALMAVSERARKRAEEVESRGSYFDLLTIHDYWLKNQTPCTPAVSLMYALRKRLEGILADEDGWYGAHLERAELTRSWARERFKVFPEEGYESVSLTCIENTRGISIVDLNAFLRVHGVIIANGYGILREKTFRIGHMGANDVDQHRHLLALLDRFLEGERAN